MIKIVELVELWFLCKRYLFVWLFVRGVRQVMNRQATTCLEGLSVFLHRVPA